MRKSKLLVERNFVGCNDKTVDGLTKIIKLLISEKGEIKCKKNIAQ